MNWKTAHIHVESYSSGCDGPIEREYVITEWGGETGRMMWAGYVGHKIDFHAYCHDREYGPASLRRFEEYGQQCLQESMPNDEGGGSFTQATLCDHNYCDTGARRYRDVYAEAAGY